MTTKTNCIECEWHVFPTLSGIINHSVHLCRHNSVALDPVTGLWRQPHCKDVNENGRCPRFLNIPLDTPAAVPEDAPHGRV